MSKLLERIIRDVLKEGRINISIETVKPEDLQIIKDVQNRLKIDSTKRKFETLDGLRVVLQRIGGRVEQPYGDKTYAIDPLELQSQVLMKLNSLTGMYKPMTGADYVWLITTDLRLNDKRDERKPKEERVFAKYSVTAIYIQKSLIAKQVGPGKTNGYIDTLRNGAHVFSLDALTASQWINRGNDDIKKGEAELVNAPFGTVSFGDHDPLVKSLNVYFNLVSEFDFELTNDYNCEIKAAVEQFQLENRLESTGNYDAKTSTRARALQSPTYVFKDKEAVKRLAAQCVADQSKTKQADVSVNTVTDIKVPTTGFAYGIKKDPEFYKVQQSMENALKVLKFNTDPKHKAASIDFIEGIKKSPGTYGDRTKKIVSLLKYVMVEKAKISLTNISDKLVDQQFIEVLTTIK